MPECLIMSNQPMPSASKTCVFCRLIAGDLPASEVYRDAHCRVILDLFPVRPGHALVLPHRHATRLSDLEPGLRDHLFRLASAVAAAQESAGFGRGHHLLVNDGPAANQSVPHVHLHLVPRRGGDGLRMIWATLAHVAGLLLPWIRRARPRPVLDREAAAIGSALAALPRSMWEPTAPSQGRSQP